MTGFDAPILRLKQIDQTGKSKMSIDESVMEGEDAPLNEKKKTYSISELIKDKILFVDQQSVLAKLKVPNQLPKTKQESLEVLVKCQDMIYNGRQCRLL